jgi:hypothetical protein
MVVMYSTLSQPRVTSYVDLQGNSNSMHETTDCSSSSQSPLGYLF